MLGIDEDYLAQRIKTIFLNAKVVDDVDSAIVPKDATMALSGAMPGLVGAIMRSGGFYAPMRRQISHRKNLPASGPETGQLTLKLWNLVVKELAEMQSFIERHWEALKPGIRQVKLNAKPVEAQTLEKVDWQTDLVLLQVKSDQAL